MSLDNVFVFTDGKMTEPSSEVVVLSDDGGFVGYYQSQSVGDPYGIHYTLYESINGSVDGWVVEFCTVSVIANIVCQTWPDLIDCLAKLSPIVQAAMFDEDTIGVIRFAMRDLEKEKSIEDARNEVLAKLAVVVAAKQRADSCKP